MEHTFGQEAVLSLSADGYWRLRRWIAVKILRNCPGQLYMENVAVVSATFDYFAIKMEKIMSSTNAIMQKGYVIDDVL